MGPAYPDNRHPPRCETCPAVHAFDQALDDYRDELTRWRDEVGDITPLEIVRAVGEERRRIIPDSPICHHEFP